MDIGPSSAFHQEFDSPPVDDTFHKFGGPGKVSGNIGLGTWICQGPVADLVQKGKGAGKVGSGLSRMGLGHIEQYFCISDHRRGIDMVGVILVFPGVLSSVGGEDHSATLIACSGVVLTTLVVLPPTRVSPNDGSVIHQHPSAVL